MYYLLNDGRKNITDIIPCAGNSQSLSYQYAPYGEALIYGVNATNACRFSFSSEYVDEELGLMYYNYRHYAPREGRWLSRDPVECTPKSLTWGYMYVGNQPFRYVDVLGGKASAIPRPGGNLRTQPIRPRMKRNPGNRKPGPPQKPPVPDPIEPEPSENADTIGAIGDAIDEICEDLDLKHPASPEWEYWDYKYQSSAQAATSGYEQCKKIHDSKNNGGAQTTASSTDSGRTQISAKKCNCCELMIAKRSWCCCDSGGEEYALSGVFFHEGKSCDEVRKEAKLLPVIQNVSLFFNYYDF